MKRRLCLIYNYAQHYRTNVFTLIDQRFICDFYFGDKMEDVKRMDSSLLSNYNELENIVLKTPFYYQKKVFKLFFKKYTHYIILGDLNCLSTWGLLLFSKLFKKKILLWSHGWYGKESFVKQILKKIYFGLADSVLLYGQYAKDLMVRNGIPERKLHVIYNSLAYDEQIVLRQKMSKNNLYSNSFDNNYYTLIFIGRLTFVKRLDLLFKAMFLLEEKQFAVNLVLVGSGESEAELQQLANQLSLKRIWFYGACYDESKLAELIYNADLCVSPGNVGLTAIHSLSFGTPVLTHDNFSMQMPEFESIQDGLTGSFFTYGSEKALADAIEKWFSQQKDRESIRRDCYSVIDNKYNPHKQIEVIEKVLKSC